MPSTKGWQSCILSKDAPSPLSMVSYESRRIGSLLQAVLSKPLLKPAGFRTEDLGLGGLYDFLPPPDPEKDKAPSVGRCLFLLLYSAFLATMSFGNHYARRCAAACVSQR